MPVLLNSVNHVPFLSCYRLYAILMSFLWHFSGSFPLWSIIFLDFLSSPICIICPNYCNCFIFNFPSICNFFIPCPISYIFKSSIALYFYLHYLPKFLPPSCPAFSSIQEYQRWFCYCFPYFRRNLLLPNTV